MLAVEYLGGALAPGKVGAGRRQGRGGAAAVSSRGPVEEARDMTPPPVRTASEPATSDAGASDPGVSDLPAAVMPRIYVRPTRKRKVDPEEKKRRRALEAEGRRRKLTLPGMPPTRR